MDRIRVKSLQLAVAAFFAINAALMLIAPHEFSLLSYNAIQPSILLWGLSFLAVALGLCLLIITIPPRWLTVAANLAAAALLAALTSTFLNNALWINSLSYGLLALGMVFATYLSARHTQRSSNVHADLLFLAIGSSAVLTELVLLSPVYSSGFPAAYPPQTIARWTAGFFILSGLLLVFVQIRKLGLNRPLTNFEYVLSFGAPLITAVFFFMLLLLAFLPEHNWILATYYGVFGSALLLLPWTASIHDRAYSSSLRVRLAFVLSAAMAVPLILTLALVSNREEKLVKEEVLARQESQAAALAQGISDYVNLHRSALVALAGQTELMSESPAQQNQQLKAFISAYPDVVYFSIFDKNGQLIAGASNRGEITPLQARQLLGETEAGSILRAPGSGQPLFGFGAPIQDAKGYYTGLVSFALSSTHVADFLKEQAVAMDGEVYLVDGEGRVIVHPDELLTVASTDLSKSPPVQKLLSDSKKTGSTTYVAGREEQLAGYAHVSGLDWGVVVERPANNALAGVYSGREIVFLLLIISLVATAVAGSLLAAWMTRPLQSLTSAMNLLAAGQSGASLPKTSFTEMQRLAIAFGRMRFALNLRSEQRERTLQELQQAKEGLAARVEERTADLRQLNLALQRELEESGRLEQALLENNKKINDILNSISDGFLTLSRDWRITYINRQAAPDRPEDAIGRNVWEIFPDMLDIVTQAGYLNVVGQDSPVELQLRNTDGTRWYNVRVYPAAGGVSVYWIDVTENRLAEREREQRLELSKQLVEVSTRILSVNTIEELLSTLAASTRRLTGARLATAGYKYAGGQFQLEANSGQAARSDGSPVRLGALFEQAGFLNNLLAQAPSLRLDAETLQNHAGWSEIFGEQSEIQALAGVRLVGRDGHATGVLLAAGKNPGGCFSEVDEATLLQLGTMASLQLQHIEARQEAERLAEEMGAVFNVLFDAITVYDLNGGIIRTNPASTRLAGASNLKTRDEVAQRLKMRHPDGSPVATKDLASSRALRGETVRGERFLVTEMDGTELVILAYASPLHDSHGKLSGAVVVWHDITESTAAEEALSNSERRLRAVLDYLPVGVWLTDNQGKIIFGNQAGQHIWSGTEYVGPEEFHIYKAWQLNGNAPLAPEDWAVTRAVRNHEITLNEMLEIECLDASHRIIRNSAVPFFDDEQKLLGVVVLNEDITDYQKALEALRGSEVRLRRLVESTLIAVNYCLVDGTVTEANEAYLRMLGYTRADLQAAKINWRKVTPPEYQAIDEQAIQEVIEKGFCTPYEKEYLRKDGSRVPVLIGFALAEEDKSDYVCFMVDLTEHKRAEKILHKYMQQLEQSNRDLEDFASIASHDLQEPLRKVRAFGDLLLKDFGDSLSQDAHDYITRMQDAAERMKVMLEGLLQYSRIVIESQPFILVDLNRVVTEVLSDLEISIQQNQGQILVETLPSVQGDPIQMHQLFQNLLSNAVKFHRPGVPPRVHVYWRAAAGKPGADPGPGQEIVSLFVEDNGIGFEEQYRDRIFEPFERLQGRSEFEGTGMGLPICRKIVERHGGWIDVESTVGAGSTFIVFLPVNQADEREDV